MELVELGKLWMQKTRLGFTFFSVSMDTTQWGGGVEPGFAGGGGGGGGGAQKIISMHAHHEREAWSPLYGQDPGPAKEPWKLSCFLYALSCYLSLFLNILIQVG